MEIVPANPTDVAVLTEVCHDATCVVSAVKGLGYWGVGPALVVRDDVRMNC